MSDEAKKNTTQELELRTGAIAILEELLPMAHWYKDDPQYGKLIKHSLAALEALPKTEPRPAANANETPAAYEKRIDPWSTTVLMFRWSDNQKAAAKKCVQHFFKNGQLGGATASTVALIDLFSLDE